ncbi:universal stress protein [Halosimplex salinum]|uniref:universal stress protein n=1 Tax=Halosimplex salinum TaxID=1710538 RepID=UPI001F43ACFC|nr:universal stress protein [Halosimplex salinum]
MYEQFQRRGVKVLVPINSPSSARKTVEHAVREYPDASITALHVSRLNAAYGIGGMYVHDPVTVSQRTHADELFETVSETADAHGGSITTMTAVGCPVREIVEHADSSDTDHIVIGSCGRTGLRRLLYQNVTHGVVYRSPVPVTVVK